MRDWKVILTAGAALVVAGCAGQPTAPKVDAQAKSAKVMEPCESRTGYFVRAGREYSDADCTIPR